MSVGNKKNRLETGAGDAGFYSFKYAAAVVAASILLYVVLVIYHTVPYGYNLSSLIRVGSSNPFFEPSALDRGTVVFTDPKSGGDGYDGQFYLYMIKDLFMGHRGIPNPFRYQRILYPALVYGFALGQAKLIPLSMLLVNLLAIALSALLLWKLVQSISPGNNLPTEFTLLPFSNGASEPYPEAVNQDFSRSGSSLRAEYLVIYTLNVGFLIAVFYDVATPLCVALIVAAAYFYARRRLWTASAMMALSLLAQENGLPVLAAMGAWEILHGFFGSRRDVSPPARAHAGWRPLRSLNKMDFSLSLRRISILALAVVPWAAWQGFLWAHYGSLPFIMSGNHFRLPFAGMISQAASLNLAGSLSDDLRQLSVYPMMLFVLALLIISAMEMKKKPTFFMLVVLVHGLIGVCFNREQIWSSTITSSARALAGVFPFLVICFAQNRSHRIMILIALSALLTLMGIGRILLMPSHPFIIL